MEQRMSDQTKEQLDYILDTFAGADGGIRYIKTLRLIEEMDKIYQEGGIDSYQAGQVLDKTIGTFVRFIELANKK
jgi:hypothetical protein